MYIYLSKCKLGGKKDVSLWSTDASSVQTASVLSVIGHESFNLQLIFLRKSIAFAYSYMVKIWSAMHMVGALAHYLFMTWKVAVAPLCIPLPCEKAQISVVDHRYSYVSAKDPRFSR